MENNKQDIVLQFEGTTKVEYTKIRTGERNILTISQKKIQLSLNTHYKFPITNNTINLTEANCISPIGEINEKIEILNVKDGIVTITPRIHGVFIESSEIIGKLI